MKFLTLRKNIFFYIKDMNIYFSRSEKFQNEWAKVVDSVFRNFSKTKS